MRTLVREKLFLDSGDLLGTGSVQGILEIANGYRHSEYFHIYSPHGDDQRPDSLYSEIARLQKEGYVEAVWIDSTERNERYQLRSIVLTIAGHKLLAELREKSAAGKFKRRLADLIWVIVVSILTTLVTLQLTIYLSK